MQVSLGFKHAARQIEIETSASHDEILGALADSATKDVVLTDDKGRKVLVPAGFPKMEAAVRGLGYEAVIVDTSEYRKIDGGLSCLSLRF